MRRFLFLLILPVAAIVVAAAIGNFRPLQPPINGQVVDERGPIAGARVRYEGDPEFVLSDDDGNFALPRKRNPRLITAWKEGHAIGAAAPGEPLRLSLLPSADDPEYRWVSPHRDNRRGSNSQACAECHEAIYDEWKLSAHGMPHGASRFRAMLLGVDVRGAVKGWGVVSQRPDGEEVCSSCHNPAPLKPYLRDHRSDQYWSQVHCDFCHKLNGPAGEVGLTHGKFGFQYLRPKRGQVFFGPLEDAHRDEENTYSTFQKDSRLCASCHEGTVFGVRAYETYSEWQASPAGRAGVECQECHMKPTGTMINMAPLHGGIDRDPKTLANHTFFDGSHQDMLKNCVRLSLDVTAQGTAVVNLGVEGVGHRVPTGLPDRSLTLAIEAFDRGGKSLASRNKVFAKMLRDFDGKSPAPFWHAVPEFEDNRLTPGKPERVEFSLPAGAAKVTAKLVYRKFWPEVAREKGWPDEAWVIAEQSWRAP